MGIYLDGVRKRGSSCGAVIEVVASGVPAGWGAPIYGKLDQDIASAMMSINAVKGVEIGLGFAAAGVSVKKMPTRFACVMAKPEFLSDHAGGILGGISSGPGNRRPLRREADILDPCQPPDGDRAGRGHGHLDQG